MREPALVRSAWFTGVAILALALGSSGRTAPDVSAGATALRFPAAVHAGTPTLPASGTLGGGVTQVTFDAPDRAGAADAFDPAVCNNPSPVPNCSIFVLSVTDPGVNKVVQVRLDWGLVTNDYDLFVMRVNGDGTETQVASSGNGVFNSRFNFEEGVFTPEANTTYHVIILHFGSSPGDNIRGRLTLADARAVVEPTRLADNSIKFSPNGGTLTTAGPAPTGRGTLTAPGSESDGEPSIRVDALGNVYAAGIRGIGGGVDVWRFGPNAYCPGFTWHDDEEYGPGEDPGDGYVWLGQPDGLFATDGARAPDGGGGDIELAVNDPPSSSPGGLLSAPNLSMVSLTLANITTAASLNRGDDWTPAVPVSAVVPADDRQWIDAFGERTVYLMYRAPIPLTGLLLQKSVDGGLTYAHAATLVNAGGLTPGWIAVDRTPNPDGSADIYLTGVNDAELVAFHCVDPTPTVPGTITCTQSIVDNTMSHGHIFDPIAVDRADNVYAAWSNDRDVFYAYSTDKGATWSNPVRVSASDAGGAMPRFSFFPWITAGDDGRVGIAWYGTDKDTNRDNGADWHVYYAFTDNARAPSPTLRWVRVSDHFIHTGNLSQEGLALTGGGEPANRNLIDFFQVAHDPRTGAAVIAFGDDHNDYDGNTFYTRQIAGPGLVAGSSLNVACAPLPPLRNPEVIDHRGDTEVLAGTPTPGADILAIDYGSVVENGKLYLTADITVDNLLNPSGNAYRAFFAVNARDGLMDTGDHYFIEAISTDPATAPLYALGMRVREADGATTEVRISRATENIAGDQVAQVFETGAPGKIRLRVDVSRLTYAFHRDSAAPMKVAGKAPPEAGDLVIGLSGSGWVATPGGLLRVERTRGGSYIILGQDDEVVIAEELECTDARISRFGGWETMTADVGGKAETYCRVVGHEGRDAPASRPYMEFQFAGGASQVRYDYFTGPRGGIVEVFVDGVSQGTIDQYAAGSDQSGQKTLQGASRTYAVTPQSAPHTLRLVKRSDLESGSRNIAYVNGFGVSGGATGTASRSESGVAFTGTAPAGESTTHTVVSAPGTLLVKAVVEPTRQDLYAAAPLTVELYDPAGVLVARSSEPVAPATVSAPALVPGEYTVKVVNGGSRAVGYRASLIRSYQP